MKRFKTASRRGFTLAELLLVIGVIAVLAAVAAPNVAKYAKKIKLRELDDSARSIYMAAQHEFKSKIAMGEKLGGDPLDSVPQRYKGEDGSGNVEKIYFKKYVKAESSGEIVSTGAIESELSENNYVIEFNPETGDVYGVFYSTDEKEFEDYDEKYGDENGKYAAAVNNTADRVSTLGYYGLKNEAVNAPPAADGITKIPSPKVSVINAEKLVLTISAPPAEGGEDISNYKLKVVLSDADTTSAGSKNILNESSALAGNGTAVIILDTLKIKDGNVSIVPEGDLSGITVEKKFSDWETGIAPGANLKIEVTLCDPKGIAIEKTETVKVNSLFANGSDRDTAVIEYGRHLQNLDKAFRKNIVIKKTVDFSNDESNYEGWANEDVYGGRKFVTVALPSDGDKKVESISANSGAQIRYLSTEGGGIFTSLDGVSVNKLEIVNASVSGGVSGAIASEAKGCTFSECRVYVESDDVHNWGDDITKDPYNSYSVAGTEAAGGIVGKSDNSTFEKCFAAVKVSSDNIAGGLIGSVSGGSTVNNCYVTGHTYNGKFEDGLKDNICGKFAGGLAGKIESGNLNLEETVFTSCSVSGETSNPICPDQDKVSVVSTNAYTLGKAYKTTDGSEAEYTLPAGMSSPAEAGKTYGDRYDNRVGPIFKYPAPSTMTLRGDWATDEAITGFFYWEIEDRAWHIHALTVSGEPQYFKNICFERDGKNIEKYGYGAFSSGALSDVTFKISDGSVIKIDPEESDSADIEGIKSALNALGVAAENVNLYNIDERGFMTATVGGSEYKFAPDFYAIYAEKSGKRAGTEDGVYGIRCKAHLENVGKYSGENSAAFVQSHDITPGVIKPIGDEDNPFKGSYDGGSYRIISARILAADGSSAGLFGATDGANLKNIVLVHPTATAAGFISLAVKEEPETISAPGSAALSALNGVRVNESLAAVSGGSISLPMTINCSRNQNNLLIVFPNGTAKPFIDYVINNKIGLKFTFNIKSDWGNFSFMSSPDDSGWNGSFLNNIQFTQIGDQYESKITHEEFLQVLGSVDHNTLGLYINGDFKGDVVITISADGALCDHEYGDWTSYDNQHHRRTCKNCGTAYEEANHSNNGTYHADDTSHWFECEVCSAEYDKTAHTLEGTATSYDEEKHTGNCAVCKQPFEQNHTLSGWTDSEDKVNHVKKCSGCDYELTEAHDFAGGSAEKCAVCGAHNPAFKSYAPTTPACVGGIVGKATGGSIENCVVAGYILQGSSAVGGIAGESTADISCCEANVKLAKCGESAKVGGIAGSGSKISASYALVHGIETPAETLGGIAGKATRVENCYVIFAGQTVGKPVADGAVSGSYYISDEGYYQGTETDGGTETTLAELSEKLPAPFGAAAKTYTSSVTATSDNYAYPAVFLADGVEHYGVEPKAIKTGNGELLARGPIVGIYEFAIWDNSAAYDGWLSYNKYGKIYDALHNIDLNQSGNMASTIFNNIKTRENDPETKSDQLYRGIIINTLVSEQERKDLRFEVDLDTGETKEYYIDDLIEKEYELRNLGAYWCEGRDTDITALKRLNDHNLHDPEAWNSTVISRFNFYIFKEFNWDDIKEIRIYYEPSDKPHGMLIYADFTKDIENYSRANLPDSQVEVSGKEPPKVGVFRIYKKYITGMYEYDGLFINTMFNDYTYNYCKGDLGSIDDARIGIMLEKDKYLSCKEDITILVNNEYFEFTPWDEPYSAANSNIKEYDGYILALIDYKMFDISYIYDLNVEVLYGKQIIHSASQIKGFFINDQSIPGFNMQKAKEEHDGICNLTLEK